MPEWVYGVDISFDQITPDEARLLKLAGVQVVAQCLYTGIQQPAVRVPNLRTLQAAGLKVAGYASITGQSGAVSMQAARDGVPDDLWNAMPHVFVDVEWPTNTLAQTVEALDKIASFGKPRSVYTSYNQWFNVMANPAHPPGSLLWNALWDLHPDIDFAGLPFGGWTIDDVIAEQWSGGTNVQGVYADRDQFRSDAFAAGSGGTPVPTPPPAPTLDQYLKACEITSGASKTLAQKRHLTATQKAGLRFLAG